MNRNQDIPWSPSAPSLPHRRHRSPRTVMLTVVIALLPAIGLHIGVYGAVVALKLLALVVVGIVADGLALAARGRSVPGGVGDASAVVTALLIGLAVPVGCPLGVSAIAVLLGLGLGKHLYGGLGQNVFNPAMVGYVAVLLSYPEAMSQWYPSEMSSGLQVLDWRPDWLWLQTEIDAYSGATVLDHARSTRLATVSVANAPALVPLGGNISLARYEPWAGVPMSGWLAGGAYGLGAIFMLWRGVVHWRIPMAFLTVLGLLALVSHLWNAGRYPPPLFHWFNGTTMLGAWFVITDPVSAPARAGAQWVFAGIAALVTFSIRSWGGYADGFAFAVLFANMLAPALDRVEAALRR